MWASFVMALISLISVLIIIRPFGMALIFVSNHLYLFVVALLTIFFTYCSFQIENFLWKHVKPLLQNFVEILLVGSTVKDLTREFDILEMKLKDVQEVIKMDEASMKKPTEEVVGWMKRVEALQPSVESIITDYANQRYLRSIRSFGRQAVNKLKEVRQVVQEVPTTTLAAPLVQLMPATPIEFGLVEFDSRLQKAVKFLKDDSQGVLGIRGMGGVGKTTLLEHINNTLAKSSSSFGFDVVVLVTASRECTPKKIREELVKMLGLSRGETADIFEYFINKSFAILLDDLWGDLDLKEVGIPLPLGMVGGCKRKLILTSRSERVCNNMGAREPAAQINVDCLSPEAALHLFRRIVGEEIISSNRTIENLAMEVAHLCGGLPAALIAVGRAMAGTREVEVWENAVNELRKSKSKFFETREEIAGTEGNPLPLLKLSYDRLKDPEKKECFLHCALWPEDFEIDIDELIRCWIGHGLLGKFDNLNEAYGKGHIVIDSLQKACLLEKVALADYEFGSRNQRVKLHDVIRDMALWIACDCGVNKNKWIVLAGQRLQEAPRDQKLWGEAHKISLMFNQIKSLPSEIQNSPNLTTLMLQENHFSDEGFTMSRYFNSLKYLDISGCSYLKCLPNEICGLTKLEYLNISKTNIRSLPEELKALVNLKYLIARELPIDSRVPPKLLSNLVNLTELDLFNSRNEDFVSSVIDNLDCLKGCLKGLGITVTTVSNLQKLVQLPGIPISSLWLERMEGLDSSLELLSHDFPESQLIWPNLRQLTLNDCESVVEVVVEGKYQLNIEGLHLTMARGLKQIKWKRVEPRNLLPKLRQLIVIDCYALKSIEWAMYLPCLELLFLRNCQEMEQLFGEEAGATVTKQEEEDRPTFPSLKKLTLTTLPKLSSICHRPLTFPSLEFLGISHCEQLKKLPFHSPSSCPKLREIHCDESTWKGIDLEDNTGHFLLPLIKIE